jgi:hypothetical protein
MMMMMIANLSDFLSYNRLAEVHITARLQADQRQLPGIETRSSVSPQALCEM